MAINPQLDGLAAKIANLESLITALDGVQPINISIGTYSLAVDPVVSPDAYNRGLDVLRGVAQSAILDLRNAIASTVLAQVAAAVAPIAMSADTGTFTDTGAGATLTQP